METLTTTAASVPTTSHLTSPVHEAHANPASPNASQDSVTSLQSHETRPGFKPHSSRSSIVSSQNTSNTELTSPSSSIESMAAYEGNSNDPKPLGQTRERTPERPVSHAPAEGDNTPFSPMSITSPMALNGAKRTASGQVKNAPTLPSTPRQYGHRSRQHSISSTGSRASEIAASLKTRLGYAMAKVHHGWEHKSLVEVEQLAAHRLSPNRYSTSILDGRPSLASLAYGAPSSTQDLYSRVNLDRSASPPSKRHSANFSTYLQSLHQGAPSSGSAPQLQPAFDIRPGSGYRHSRPAPYPHLDDAMSPPRTPVNNQPRRPPTIRTQTQTAEAERDALQALFQLGSPHASQVPQSHASASQAASTVTSPLRSEFSTPRRVAFEWANSGSDARSSDPSSQPQASDV